MEFSPPGGSGMELASSDAAAILFFLYKEKEKNGAQSGRTGSSAPTSPLMLKVYFLEFM